MSTRRGDELNDIGDSDIVQLSRGLLDATVKSTAIMQMEEMTPAKLQEARLVLGFLNATNAVMKTKMQYFRMAGLTGKIDAVKERSKSL